MRRKCYAPGGFTGRAVAGRTKAQTLPKLPMHLPLSRIPESPSFSYNNPGMIRQLLIHFTHRRGPRPFSRHGLWLAVALLAGHLAPLAALSGAPGGSSPRAVCPPVMRCSKDPNGCCCRKPLDDRRASALKCPGGEGDSALTAKLFLPVAYRPLTPGLSPPATPERPHPARPAPALAQLPSRPPTPPPEAV